MRWTVSWWVQGMGWGFLVGEAASFGVAIMKVCEVCVVGVLVYKGCYYYWSGCEKLEWWVYEKVLVMGLVDIWWRRLEWKGVVGCSRWIVIPSIIFFTIHTCCCAISCYTLLLHFLWFKFKYFTNMCDLNFTTVFSSC